MNKVVVFVMLLSYCVARSIDESGDVLDTPIESVFVETGDTKPMDEIIEENPAQIETQSNIMDAPVHSDDNTRFLFTTIATTTTAPVRPFTQTIDLLLVLNSNLMTARK